MTKKQKIEVNEGLNVSIGDLLKLKIPGDNGVSKTEHPERNSVEASVISKNISPNKEAEPNLNVPEMDIKKIIPKFSKISLQHQRSGRGGKTVTLVYLSGETELKSEANLVALLKELKKALGCGGQIEEGKIVLHGEIASRASEWFAKMGAKL
jgi:translation initiation factor 1